MVKHSKNGFISMGISMGISALSIMSVGFLYYYAHSSSNQISRQVNELYKFYGGEIAAWNTLIDSSQGNPTVGRYPLSFDNSSRQLLASLSAGTQPATTCSHHPCPLEVTHQFDTGTSFFSHLWGIFGEVSNTNGVTQYCGDAQAGPTFSWSKKFHRIKNVCLNLGISCQGSSSTSCYVTEPIDQLYRALLGREPGVGETGFWVDKVQSGTLSIQQVEGLIRESAEYGARAPNDCQNPLGQTHTYTNTQRRLGARYAEDVTALYRTFLGRFPDPGGLTYWVRLLLGCPTAGNPVAPTSLDSVVSSFHSAPEFTNAAGNNQSLHAEPMRELYLMMLGRDPAMTTSDFPADLNGLKYWVGKLAGQSVPNVNRTLSLNLPPFVYGGPSAVLWDPGSFGTSLPAMFYSEVQTNPGGGRTVGGIPVGYGIAESPEYIANGSGQAEKMIALFRTLLDRVPHGPAPRDEIDFYSLITSHPYNAPLSYVTSLIKASHDFSQRSASGCRCNTVPAPLCSFQTTPSAVSGETVNIKLYTYANTDFDSNGKVKLGGPSPGWNGISPPGTITDVSWNGPQTIGPGAQVYSQNRTAGAPGTTLTETATVTGPGGSTSCSFSIAVLPPKMTCTIHMRRRGPGSGSRYVFGGSGDVREVQGPYSLGGGNSPHSFYGDWSVWIPGRPDSEFQFTNDGFRTGSGFDYIGTTPATMSGSYDPCNRNYSMPGCISNYTTMSPMPMPAMVTMGGVNYKLMTRLSDGAAQDYANGGTCGSDDCKCFLSGVVSPLVVLFDAQNVKFEGTTLFDLGEGPSHYRWPGRVSGQAFLVLDRNRNGRIDDYQELFGSHTPPERGGDRYSNGFMALAKYDDTQDNLIDKGDRIFDSLRLWFDQNGDGRTQPEELESLSRRIVQSIDLRFASQSQILDPFGNSVQQTSIVTLKNKSRVSIVDLWFAPTRP